MSNVTEQDRGEDFIESSSLTAEEIERALEESLPKIESIETKWLQLKTEDVVGSLNQILVFSRNSEMSGQKEKKLYAEIDTIISNLRTSSENDIYMRVVRVIERYLTGMRRFLSTKYTQGASFYKSLFDANMIAIVREVKVLEMQMS